MSQNTIVVLLPNTPHSGGEGNVYAIVGEPKQASSYTVALRNMQTVSWNLSNNFIGNIVIQASLDTTPTPTGNWATIHTIITPNPPNPVFNGFVNLQGNYVWLRAVATNWTQGTIQQIVASY